MRSVFTRVGGFLGGLKPPSETDSSPPPAISRRESIVRTLAALILIATPALAFVLGLKQMGYHLADYGTSAIANDMTAYYLQMRNFAHHGFSCGYHVIGETPARPPFTHPFGCHGPLYPMFYGFLGRIFGFHCLSPLLIHLGILTSALATLVLIVRPKPSTSLLLSGLLLTWWSFYLQIYTTMQEPFHMAVAAVAGACFHRLLTDSRPRAWVQFGLFALLATASLVRIDWALLFIPYYLIVLPRRTWAQVGMALAAGATTVLALMLAYSRLCAPFDVNPSAFMMNKLVTLSASMETLQKQAWANLEVFRQCFVFRGSKLPWCYVTLPIRIHVGVLGVCLAAVVIQGIMSWRRRGGATSARGRTEKERIFLTAYILFAVTVAEVLVYFTNPRVLAIHLIVTLVLFACSRARWMQAIVAAVIVANLTAIQGGGVWKELRPMHFLSFNNSKSIQAFHDEIQKDIQYRPGADRWENTVLTNIYPPDYVGLPAGIGASYFLPSWMPKGRPVKSRYVIADPEGVASFAGELRLICQLWPSPKLGIAPEGKAVVNLYLNLHGRESEDSGPPKSAIQARR